MTMLVLVIYAVFVVNIPNIFSHMMAKSIARIVDMIRAIRHSGYIEKEMRISSPVGNIL